MIGLSTISILILILILFICGVVRAIVCSLDDCELNLVNCDLAGNAAALCENGLFKSTYQLDNRRRFCIGQMVYILFLKLF